MKKTRARRPALVIVPLKADGVNRKQVAPTDNSEMIGSKLRHIVHLGSGDKKPGHLKKISFTGKSHSKQISRASAQIHTSGVIPDSKKTFKAYI